MNASSTALRKSIGSALRRIRRQGHLSLDEVESLSRQSAIGISRSHLSRVETGHADIALSRFLTLMLVLGYPVGDAAEELEPLITGTDAVDLESIERLRDGDPLRLARALRELHAAGAREFEPATTRLWAEAEAAVGNWRSAARLFARALPCGAPATAATALATALLGQGLSNVARVLVSAIEREDALGAAILRACCLLTAGGDASAAAGALSAAAHLERSRPRVRALARGLAADCFRRAGQRRSALAIAKSAAQSVDEPRLKAELLRFLARALGEIARPGAGLRALDRARALARQSHAGDLLASIHLDRQVLCLRAGDRAKARTEGRAARAILRRMGADRQVDRGLPLHGLLAICADVGTTST